MESTTRLSYFDDGSIYFFDFLNKMSAIKKTKWYTLNEIFSTPTAMYTMSRR